MVSKISYILVDCIAVLGIYFTVRAVDKNIKEPYAKWFNKAMIAAIFAIFANILVALSFSYFSAGIAYCLYFSSIDWIIYYLVGFCLLYTEHEKALKLMYRPAAIVMAIDSLSILLNPVFGHEFYTFAKHDSLGVIYYQTRFHIPYYIHLTIDYIAMLIALFFIVFRLIKTYSVYRVKYVIILSVLLLVVFLNVAYMGFELPLDASVVFYAVAGILIYFSIQILVPRNLKMSSIERAIDDMNEGLILFDISNNCIYANDFSKRRFSIDEATYDITKEPAATVLENLKSADSAFGEVAYTRNVTIDNENVTEHYIIKCSPLNDHKGRIIGSYFLIEDNTEQVYYLNEIREAKELADEANHAKSSFLANMSHEIRTPLNSVLGLNEMILRTTTDPQLKEYAENIRISGDALLSLISDILDFSKIEAKKMDVVPVEYDPHHLLRECNTFFEQMADSKDLVIEVTCDESIPSKLCGDVKLIKQILNNIISNAIKYTRKGGVKVHLASRPVSSADQDLIEMVLTVSDTGIGISQADIDVLFDAFKRINEKENATIQGTGLGLAITKELVTLMNGTISVESTQGEGSTFKIIVPQKVIDPTPAGEYKKHVASAEKQYKESFTAPDAHLLIVDDAMLNLKVAVALLKNTHMQIDTASGGQQAIDMCKETKYDLILLDHRMPEPDGIETYKVISKEGLNTDTPVIMLTANVVSGAEEEYKKIGFVDYLSKPIHGEDLEAALIKHLPPEKVVVSVSTS